MTILFRYLFVMCNLYLHYKYKGLCIYVLTWYTGYGFIYHFY